MNISGKKIGIWGYGIVGKAAVSYFSTKKVSLSICDSRALPQNELASLQAKKIPFYPQEQLDIFLKSNDLIMPSPGIDLRPYASSAHKWIRELDLFAQEWHKPIIAITGTVGKTSIINLIGLLLDHANIPVAIGGNIGIGMLSLINQQKKMAYALLEVSSWQLERCRNFAPSIALWTNFSENHLDRHVTMDNYFDAKYQIMAHQGKQDRIIAPLSLKKHIYIKNPRSSVTFFYNGTPTYGRLREQDALLYLENNQLFLVTAQEKQCIAPSFRVPESSFINNWIAISALLRALKLPIDLIYQIDLSSYAPPDRLEFVCTKNGVSFYNDSKSTTPASTLASVQKFSDKRIHLFLGGLSKGINRAPLINVLKNNVKHIYCFGKEAQHLKRLCDKAEIPANYCTQLQEALHQCMQNCQRGDIVLFSPAGSSFDLFTNYHERGKRFKNLVHSTYFSLTE